MLLVQTGAMTKTPRLPTELETPGARRITVETCFSASVLVMAEVNGSAKDTHPCIRLALVSGASQCIKQRQGMAHFGWLGVGAELHHPNLGIQKTCQRKISKKIRIQDMLLVCACIDKINYTQFPCTNGACTYRCDSLCNCSTVNHIQDCASTGNIYQLCLGNMAF